MGSSAGVWVPILVALVTAFATVITVFLTGRGNLKLEREKFTTNSELERQKFEASSRLERQKFEASLVLQAIATGQPETAQKNLIFLVKAGFLPDPEGHIKQLADAPEETPVLPASSAVEPPQPGSRPPSYRWPVRTGSDPDAHLVEAKPVPATVEELVAQPRPADMLPVSQYFQAYQNRRAEGVERTIYRVEATIIASRFTMGQNYYLILQGASGETMIASCPHPDFIGSSSRWAKEIATVRSQVQDTLKPDERRKRVSERARVTGVGFFNHVHRQTGVAPNGIELTPVLGIEWLVNSDAPAADVRAGRSRGAR